MQIRWILKVVLLVVVLGLKGSGYAQGNLLNLYTWTNATMHSSNPQHNVQIESFNSARFAGSLGTNNPYSFPVTPILTGNLATTPGASYEISFTMENMWITDWGPTEVSFGNFTTNFDLPRIQQRGSQYQYFPVNLDFTVLANSSTTTMTFTVAVDVGGANFLERLLGHAKCLK